MLRIADEIGANKYVPNEAEFLKNSLKIYNEWGLSYAIFQWLDLSGSPFRILKDETMFITGGDLDTSGQIAVDAIAAG